MAHDPNVDVSMSEVIEAFNKGYRQFKMFEHGLAVARKVAGLEQAEREVLSRIADLTSKADAVALECSARKAKALREATEAEAHAAKISIDAQANADKIIQSAQADAKAMVDSAKSKKTELEKRNKELADSFESLSSSVREQQGVLDSITSQIEAARAAKKALLEA